MPSPSWDVSVAWLCLCPVALATDLLAFAVVFHFRPIQHSVDVALASLFVTMATDVFLLLPFPAIIRLANDLRWTKDACTCYNWLASTLRASSILALLLLNLYWVAALRTSADPSVNSVRPGRIFSSAKLMKMAVSISWVVSIIIGMVPVAGETRVFDYYESDPYGRSCWFLPHSTDIGFSLFFIILVLACLFISLISAADTLLLFRHMRHYAVTKFSTGRRVSIPGHVTGVDQSDSPIGHPQHSELSVSRELCRLGFCITLCSSMLNALPFVVSQFVQLTQGDYDQVAMETTLLWLLLVEALVIPHLLWMLSGRYRHALRFLWRVYVLRDSSAKEEDATACTLQAFRMKTKDWNIGPYKNGSVAKINGTSSHDTGSNLDPSPGQSGLARSNGSPDPFTVKVISSNKTSAQVPTTSGVLELDDGMAVASSLPYRSAAVALKDMSSAQIQSSSNGMSDAESSVVEHVHILNAETNNFDSHKPKMAVESLTTKEVSAGNQLSPQGMWASRIAYKDTARLGPNTAMSQSTPNTPTKSLGISPLPPSRRIGSSSSSGSSSNSRVKRSVSATSRQEWKERMRKKHLPAIFVNTSFEEDSVDGASVVHHGSRSRQFPRAPVAETQATREVRNETGTVSDATNSQNPGDENASINSDKEMSQNPPVHRIYHVTADSHISHHQAFSAPSLQKQTTLENEGMSGMYEDGDIIDILDNDVTNKISDLELEPVKGIRQANVVTASETLGEERFYPSDEQPLQKLPESEHSQFTNAEQGIDNPAFDMSTEMSLPGSIETGVFYDDTLVTNFTKISDHAVNLQGSDLSQQKLVSNTPSSSDTRLGPPTTLTEQSSSVTLPDQSPIQQTSASIKTSIVEGGVNEPSMVGFSPSVLHGSPNKNQLETGDGQNSSYVEVGNKSANENKLEADEELVGAEKPTRTATAVELTAITQDWSQLETVSGSEMLLYKTQQVTAAAAVILESSIDEEEDEDCRENDTSRRTEEAGSSDGGQRVDEQEWTSVSAANLASFSTRENLNEVGQMDYVIGTYDVTPQPSPLSRDRGGQGDGAESESDTTLTGSSEESSIETYYPTHNSLNTHSNIRIKQPNPKLLIEEQNSDKNQNVKKSADTFSDSHSLGYKSTPVDGNVDSRNAVFFSQDSMSDSVFESPKSLSPAKTVHVPLPNPFARNITQTDTSPSPNVAQLHNADIPQPTSVQSVNTHFPKPLPSMTPTIPPTRKPPRGVGRRNRGNQEVFARLTSSEDELDAIFVGDEHHDSKADLHSGLHVSKDNDVRAAKPFNGEDKNYDHFSSESIDTPGKSTDFVISTNSNTIDTSNTSKTRVSSDEMITLSEPGDSRQTAAVAALPKQRPRSSNGVVREDSVTLEPYGKRVPQWLEDIDSHHHDSSLPWSTDDAIFPNPQSVNEGYQRPKLKSGEETIVYVDKVPENYAPNLGVRMQQDSQISTDFRFTPTMGTTTLRPSHTSSSLHHSAKTTQAEAEVIEYKLDSVDVDGDSRTTQRYKKNPRSASSRSLKKEVEAQSPSYQYDETPPPPPYYASHVYRPPPSVQSSQQPSLTQYHFDEDIDRGFEEALSMDYHPFAPLTVSSHMSSLYAPGISSGLYFESISEEPEESLSLTEMVEASSLNGDSIFKTQAVISRPSSRASFTASSDNQQPENQLSLSTMPSRSSDLLLRGNSTNQHGGVFVGNDADGMLASNDLGNHDPFKIDFVPTSERTSADGSETTEPAPGNGCYVSQAPNDLLASLPVKSRNPWGFDESTSFFNDSSNITDMGANSLYSDDLYEQSLNDPSKNETVRESSPWLNLDILVTNAPDPSGDNQLDMSFGSDFSSDHTLAESISKEVLDINDYEYELKTSRDNTTAADDSYTEFERDARPSTPQHSSSTRSSGELDKQKGQLKPVISSAEQEQTVTSAYF
ncbi:hypothetical protein ElyMa_002579500 [Elysia marginata]|uniref:G-protein coupled receptors family 1 profile domain-containing protein n=1 Tax=Elysia marginata TaxID=1093978 RepID=A0AAV4GYE4_9GAST|nr:hypothetical protein ElyMa_002579500 [Elysia marginata]